MKNFIVVAVLTIAIISTSSVFVHFLYNLTEVPGFANGLNFHLVKKEREFLHNFKDYKEKVLGNWEKSFDFNDNVAAFDLRLKKHCVVAICPMAMAINLGGVKATGMLRERY